MDVTRESMKTSRRAPATRGMDSMAAKAGWVWDASVPRVFPRDLLAAGAVAQGQSACTSSLWLSF